MIVNRTVGALRARTYNALACACAAACASLAATPATAYAQDTTRAIRDTAGLRAMAGQHDSAATLAAVTVIGSRTDIDEARERMLNIPGGVDMISPTELRSSRQANLHDALRFTPGVYVQPRYGAADESQISIRGSGLRNNFHARGVNLLVNGMPYRNADGFTDFESLELLTTEAIEVYKGANALRYGGSTLGGAINLDTQTGYTAPPLTAYLQGGSHGFMKAQLAAAGMGGALDWYGSIAHTQLGGYRAWSDNRRERVNLHAGYRTGNSTDIRAFYFFAHVQEHLPGAVDRQTLETAPATAFADNVTNRWGRTYDLHHIGVQYRAQLSPTQRLEVSPYLQYRDIDHPIYEVIAQISRDWGAEVRYENEAKLFGRANRLTLGFQPALENMESRQFQNVAGKHGAPTRDERDRATTLALYAENAFTLTPRITAIVGARADRSTRAVQDHFPANGDQTDDLSYATLSPRVGLLARLGGAELFVNASRSVEPPLLLELTSFGNPGGFNALDAQSAWQYEIGGRAHSLGLNWELSLYDIELRRELLNANVEPFAGAGFTVPTYRNVPRTRHAGVEAGISFQKWTRVLSRGDVRDAVSGRVSYAYNRFIFREDAAFGGHRLPGAPSQYVTAELRYQHPTGFSLAPSVEWVPSDYWVNSANTVRNSSWATLALRAEWPLWRFGATLFASAENLTDTRYSGSVQVDTDGGRFFEPSDPRSFYAGFRLAR